MSSRIDIFAFLHANRRSVNNSVHEISDALRQAGRDGSDAMAQEIENAAPRVRRAANRVKDATITADRAERQANKTREESARLLERRIQLESDHADASEARARAMEREIELENRLRAARAGTEKINQQIYEQERRRDEQKAKADALNSYVRDKNLGLRDKRLARTKANQEGDKATARRLSKEINADDTALQPARKRQIAENRKLREEEAALATLRERLAGHNEDVSRTETDLKSARAEAGAATRDVTKLESDLVQNRRDTVRVTEESTRATEDATRATRHQEEALRSLHETEEAETRRQNQRNNRRGRGRGGGFGHTAAGNIGNIFTDIPGVPGGPLGAVLGPAVVIALGSVAEAVVTASQSLALLPAVATAAGAGIATLAIGFDGLGKAIKDMDDPKKFAKDLAQLGPAAQQVALEIQHLASPEGPFGQLKSTVEGNLFKGIPEALHSLSNSFAPTLERLTGGIASAFNSMFDKLSSTLQTDASKLSIANIVDNIVLAFQRLTPAVQPFTQAILKIVEVGADFLPKISDSIVNVANTFNQFIQKAAQDGSLQNFIQKGIDAAGALLNLLLELGQKIYQTFGNKSPEDFVQMIDHVIRAVITVSNAIVGIAEAVDSVLPALDKVADAVGGWPVLIGGAIAAFVGFKLVVGPILTAIAIQMGMQGITGALLGMGPAAATAGAGITAGLGAAAAMLAGMAAAAASVVSVLSLGGSSNSDPTNLPDTDKLLRQGATAKQIEDYQQAKVNGDQATMNRIKDEVGKGALAKLGPGGINPDFQIGPTTNASVEPGALEPIQQFDPNFPLPPGYERPQVQAPPTAGLNPYHPFDVPAVPPTGGAGGGKAARTHGPEVPYSGDPMSLIQGYQPTAALYNAAGALLDKRQKVAQDEADLNKMLAENTATEDEITKKRNDLEKDKREAVEAELRLDEAKASANKKALKGLKDTDNAFSEIGAGLDKDLGFSKGLPGLADNLVRFVAALATAPLKGLLAPIAKQGDGSSGLLGMMFGGSAKDSEQQSLRTGVYPGMAGVGPRTPFSVPGETPRDFAHRAMMPYWQSQGFTVGDHAADQYGEHQNGALDIMVPSIAEGQKVLQQVLSDSNVYGAIFDNKTYGYGRGTTPQDYTAGYTGNPTQDHQDHVHAWYKPGGANNLPPGAIPPDMMSPGVSVGPSGGTTPVFVTNWPGGAGGQFGAPGIPGLTPPGADWDAMAMKESSGNWAANTGNGYYGGLQFTQSSWDEAGGQQYARRADLATAEQQKMIAEQLLKMQGPGAWPNTFTPAGSPSAGAPAGGPLSTGMPRGLPTAPLGPVSPADSTFAGAQGPTPGVTPGLNPYTAQGMPQGQQGWQPNSSGGIGFGGGLIGAGLQAAMSAAGTAGAPFGGQAAAAAAQMAMQLIDRSTKYLGQLGGIATEGILSTFAPSNPDSGASPLRDSWLWRAAGALAGATPALGSGGAAMLDKMSQKKQAEDQGQQAQQQGQQGQQSPAQSGPLVNIEQMVQGQQSGKSLGQDIAGQLQQQVILPR